MRILAIAGSLRRDSHNARLLRYVAERAPAGVEVEIWDGLRSIPPYDADSDTDLAPAPVADLRRAIASADALLIATPEYNASIPGVLKNAIDWASRPRASTVLQNKPVAVIGASTGSFGAVWAQAELRKVLAHTGARVVDLDLPAGEGRATHSTSRERCAPRSSTCDAPTSSRRSSTRSRRAASRWLL